MFGRIRGLKLALLNLLSASIRRYLSGVGPRVVVASRFAWQFVPAGSIMTRRSLFDSTPARRRRCQILGDGHGVRWPNLDEDLSADGMLSGVPAASPAAGRTKTAVTRQHTTPSSPRKGRRKAAPTTTRQS